MTITKSSTPCLGTIHKLALLKTLYMVYIQQYMRNKANQKPSAEFERTFVNSKNLVVTVAYRLFFRKDIFKTRRNLNAIQPLAAYDVLVHSINQIKILKRKQGKLTVG